MKFLHWVIFILAFWLLISPLIGDELLNVFITGTDITQAEFLRLVRWDDFFLGLAVMVIALIILTAESASHSTPGLKAMHWLQVLLGAFVAIAPFIFAADYLSYQWAHYVTGSFIALFALLQIYLEPSEQTR